MFLEVFLAMFSGLNISLGAKPDSNSLLYKTNTSPSQNVLKTDLKRLGENLTHCNISKVVMNSANIQETCEMNQYKYLSRHTTFRLMSFSHQETNKY